VFRDAPSGRCAPPSRSGSAPALAVRGAPAPAGLGDRTVVVGLILIHRRSVDPIDALRAITETTSTTTVER
jgi:hypothetical protein